MDGFKDSTKMKYMMGGDVKAYKTGGVVKKMAFGGATPPLGGTALTTPTATPTQSQSGNSGVVVGPRAQARNARMGPVGRAKGGVIKKGNGGGVFNEKGKRATWDEVAAEGRRMEGRKPPVEGISSRPTDSSGRRMTNKELGMTPGGVDTAKRKGVPAHSSKPMIRRKTGGLAVMPGKKC